MPALGQGRGSSSQSRDVFPPSWSGGNVRKKVHTVMINAQEMYKVSAGRARLRARPQSQVGESQVGEERA